MSTTEIGANFVKVNRLKDGWTCYVSVTADDNTTEALQDAKVKALAIIRELNKDLNPGILREVRRGGSFLEKRARQVAGTVTC